MLDRGALVGRRAERERLARALEGARLGSGSLVLIAGEEDRSAGAVSFRFRDGSQKNGVPVEDAIAEILTAIETRAQV